MLLEEDLSGEDLVPRFFPLPGTVALWTRPKRGRQSPFCEAQQRSPNGGSLSLHPNVQ